MFAGFNKNKLSIFSSDICNIYSPRQTHWMTYTFVCTCTLYPDFLINSRHYNVKCFSAKAMSLVTQHSSQVELGSTEKRSNVK